MKDQLKRILAKNRKVNAELLEESLKVSRRLQKAGVSIRKDYNLRSPFEKRLVKASAAELVHSTE
jgi:hypothetical protein